MIKIPFYLLLFSWLNILFQFFLNPVREYPYKSDFFELDQLGGIYTVYQTELNKYDQNNNHYNYSNSLLGRISKVDCSDPFRILVFNQDFNKIIFLDNKLTEITTPISISDLGYNALSVCQSRDGGFWIFDNAQMKLISFDKNLNQQNQSIQISSLLKADQIEDVFMLERGERIYLGIRNEGILVFDTYGTYLKTFPITNIRAFQVVDNKIIYCNNDKLTIYDITNFNKEILDLPKKKCISARVKQNEIILQFNDKLIVYELNNK